MNKNMVKRAWLSIKRKPSKSVILFIIMFVIANLVLASLAISNAVLESTNYAKEIIGGEVYLNADMESIKTGISGGMPGERPDMSSVSSLMERPTVTVDMVLELAGSSYVKDYTYSVAVMATPNLTLYESENQSFMGMNRNSGGITAINSYAFISEVENNTITISEGTYFDESTDNSVIISYELALLNELTVGDVITITNNETDILYEYNVIGIFTSTVEGFENNIYMNVKSSEQLMYSSQYNDGNYSVNNVVYYLDNPDNVELFKNETNSKYDLEELNLILDIDTEAYDQMAGPIESVGGFADTILIIVIMAAILIITLIINNSIKDRKYEMGVLMSLGAPKKNIIGQILIELVVVSTAAFILSIGTSSFIATMISDNLLESQLSMNEEVSESNFGRPMGGMSRPGMNDDTLVEVIDEIDVNVTTNEYILLFIIGYLIVIIAMIIPSINIMKYEPKTILTGRE